MIPYAKIKTALHLPGFDGVQAQRHMAPEFRGMKRPQSKSGNPRLAAVMALFFPGVDGQSLVLIRRTERPGSVHSGQISFPGGRQEPGETFERTALRETFEEVGVDPSHIHIIGKLTTLYVPPSDFEIHPFVGYLEQKPAWRPQVAEVAEIIEMPLHHLFDERYKCCESRELNGGTFNLHYYNVHGHKVWGATAIMLGELETRLRQVHPV